MRTGRSGPLAYLAVVVAIIGFVNFFWFIFESERIHGDALNGYQAGGRYFVGSHGSYTEVSQATWEWSRAHAISVFITHPLAMAAMAFLVFGAAFPRIRNRRAAPRFRTGAGVPDEFTPPPVASAEQPVAVARCGGRIGGMSFGLPLLKVAVYADRFTIRGLLMAERTVLGSQISLVSRRTGWSRGVLIEHTAPGVASPILLALSDRHRLGYAIELIECAEPEPAAPAATRPASRYPPPINILGVVAGLVLAGFGAVTLAKGDDGFSVVLIAFALFMVANSVRDLLRGRG